MASCVLGVRGEWYNLSYPRSNTLESTFLLTDSINNYLVELLVKSTGIKQPIRLRPWRALIRGLGPSMIDMRRLLSQYGPLS